MLSAQPKLEKFRMQEPGMEQCATMRRVPSREYCKGFLRVSVNREEENAPFSFLVPTQRATRNEVKPRSCEVK